MEFSASLLKSRGWEEARTEICKGVDVGGSTESYGIPLSRIRVHLTGYTRE